MKKIYIGKSKIAGRGMCAGEDIKRGELIALLRGPVRHLHIKTKRDARIGPTWIGISARRWIDPMWPFNRINHSCDANSGFQGSVRCRALRTIRKGEEITLDYSTTESSPLWTIRCSCKAKRCRKVIRSIQFLSYDVFKSYLPYIPTYFQKIYRRSRKNKHGTR